MYRELKKILNDSDLSVYKLSKITGIASQDLYNALNGKKELYPGWKKRIATALNMDAAELFGEMECDTIENKNN